MTQKKIILSISVKMRRAEKSAVRKSITAVRKIRSATAKTRTEDSRHQAEVWSTTENVRLHFDPQNSLHWWNRRSENEHIANSDVSLCSILKINNVAFAAAMPKGRLQRFTHWQQNQSQTQQITNRNSWELVSFSYLKHVWATIG